MQSFAPLSSPSQTTQILNILRPRLPVCLPIYRRIQFGHFTPTARITTSFPPTSPPPEEEPWVVFFSDPDRGPETQAFLYGSWEVPDPTEQHDPRVEALLRDLVLFLRDGEGLFAPQLRTELTQARITTVAGDGYEAATDKRHLVMMGGIHETTARGLHRLGLLDPGFVHLMGGTDDGMPEKYNKWIFDLRGTEGRMGDEDLPQGLRWGMLQTRHYALVRSRTSIPRLDRTLGILPTVAIFPTDRVNEEANPVAWLFLGVDSSLTTMHVEPECRGQGLAKLLARQAWRKHLDYYRTKFVDQSTSLDERWAHADVAVDNIASNAVCKSLGGTVRWGNYWQKIDLTRLAN